MATRKSRILAAALLGCLGRAGLAAEPLVSPADLHAAGLRDYWEATLPLGASDEIDAAYLVDEVLYVVSREGTLFALTADVGMLRWAQELVAADYAVFPPTHAVSADNTGLVVVPTTPGVFLLDRFSGQLIRRFVPPFALSGPAIMSGEVFLSGSADGRFYALRVNPAGAERPFKVWDVKADGPITAAPRLFDGNKLLFASQGGTVYSCVASDKAFRWSFPIGDAIMADPVVDESGVYVSSVNRSLYKLDRATGAAIWRVRFSSALDTRPAVAAQTVYQFDRRDGICALDFDTGKVRWRVAAGVRLASHSAAGDILLSRDKRLLVVDHAGGQIVNETPVRGGLDVVTNTVDDAVYLLGSGGRVQCLRLDSVPYLRRQRAISARRQLNLPPARPGDVDEPLDTRDLTEVDRVSDDPLRSSRDGKRP